MRAELRYSGCPLLGLLFMLGLAAARPAAAFQCELGQSQTSAANGPALAWPKHSSKYTFNNQFTAQLPASSIRAALAAAASAWTQEQLQPGQDSTCAKVLTPGSASSTDFSLSAAGVDTPQSYVGYNWLVPQSNLNVILFRDVDANGHNDPRIQPDPNAGLTQMVSSANQDVLARTWITYSRTSGEILDADILFNTTKYRFTVDPNNTDPGIYDLQFVATHEFGHFLGFDHPQAQDTNFPTAVMHPETSNTPAAQLLRRALTCDDLAIMLLRYPGGQATTPQFRFGTIDGGLVGTCGGKLRPDQCGTCNPPSSPTSTVKVQMTDTSDSRGGCSCRAGPAAAPAWLLAGLGGLRRRWRRGRRRRHPGHCLPD